jgi:hypothetical protein
MSTLSSSSTGGIVGGVTFPGDNSIYRWSSYGALVVAYDAYRYTLPRYANLVSIAIVTAVGILYMIIRWWITSNASTSAKLLPHILSCRDRGLLASVSSIALLANGVHFYDNFSRMEVYHLPRWIYHGLFAPLDWSCLYWHVSTFLCLVSFTILTSRLHHQDIENEIPSANGGRRYWLQRTGLLTSSTPADRVRLARWIMYIHCFMVHIAYI